MPGSWCCVSARKSVGFMYRALVPGTSASLHRARRGWRDCQYGWIRQSGRILLFGMGV
jgi:hypothetical protein